MNQKEQWIGNDLLPKCGQTGEGVPNFWKEYINFITKSSRS